MEDIDTHDEVEERIADNDVNPEVYLGVSRTLEVIGQVRRWVLDVAETRFQYLFVIVIRYNGFFLYYSRDLTTIVL